MKKCRFCAEEVQDDAVVCKHCGKSLKESKLWWLLAIVLIIGLFFGFGPIINFFTGTPSTERLAQYVHDSIEKEYKTKYPGIKIGELTLVHKSGNEYNGLLEIEMAGQKEKHAVEVINDNEHVKWQIEQ